LAPPRERRILTAIRISSFQLGFVVF